MLQSLLENSLACSQMAKHRLTIWLSNSAARIISQRKKTYIHVKTCVQMFRMTLFIIVKKRKLWCPSTDEQMTTMCQSHREEQDSTRKSNEELLHAVTWINLGNMLSERSPDTKGHVLCKSIWNVQNRQIDRNRE